MATGFNFRPAGVSDDEDVSDDDDWMNDYKEKKQSQKHNDFNKSIVVTCNDKDKVKLGKIVLVV